MHRVLRTIRAHHEINCEVIARNSLFYVFVKEWLLQAYSSNPLYDGFVSSKTQEAA